MIMKSWKQISFVSTLIIVALISFIYLPEPDLKPFDKPKYSDHFHTRMEPTFFDYNEALKVAKKNNRLLFVNFTGRSIGGDRSLRYWPLEYGISRNFIKNKMVYCELYVDDRTKLDSSEMILTSNDSITTLGQKNQNIQINTFKTYGLPFNAIINPNNQEINSDFNIRNNIENNIKILKAYYGF
jgi:hypothetical protein